MRKIVGLSAAFLLLLMPVSQAANPKTGASCTKLKATAVYNGKLFTCVTKGKAKVWDKGALLKQGSKPRSTASPKATTFHQAGYFGVVRTISNNGGKAQPMDCKVSDGNQGFRSQRTFFVDPKNPNILGIGIEFKGFYISTDAGATWEMSSAGLIGYPLASNPNKPCHTEFSTLVLDPQNSQHLLVSRSGEPGTIKDYFSENAGIYESKNGGFDWKQILTQPGIGVYVHDGLAISHQNPLVIYAGTTTNARSLNGDNKVYVKKGVIYKTTNGGKTWVELPTGAPADIGVAAIVVDPKNDRIVTASTFGRVMGAKGNTFGSGLGIIKSVDGGATWKRIDTLTSGFSAIEFAQNNPQLAFGITYDSQVLSSNDGGATWNKVDGVFSVRSIAYYSPDVSAGEGLIVQDDGKVIAFGNNGAVIAPAGQIPALSGHATRATRIAFSSDGSWYVAGHYTNNKSHQIGFVFKSTDRGLTWERILDTDAL